MTSRAGFPFRAATAVAVVVAGVLLGGCGTEEEPDHGWVPAPTMLPEATPGPQVTVTTGPGVTGGPTPGAEGPTGLVDAAAVTYTLMPVPVDGTADGTTGLVVPAPTGWTRTVASEVEPATVADLTDEEANYAKRLGVGPDAYTATINDTLLTVAVAAGQGWATGTDRVVVSERDAAPSPGEAMALLKESLDGMGYTSNIRVSQTAVPGRDWVAVAAYDTTTGRDGRVCHALCDVPGAEGVPGVRVVYSSRECSLRDSYLTQFVADARG